MGIGVLSRRARERRRSAWDANGFLVLPRFFAPNRIDTVNRRMDEVWAERRRPDNPLVIDVLDGELRDRRLHFRDASDDARRVPYKLNDLYLVDAAIRDLALDRRLVAILRDLLGGDPAVCNSLNFERGSQQEYHFDTYYMPAPCVGGLIVTSICLEDVHVDAGPLTYFPGSHRIDPYRFSHGGVHAVPDEMRAATEYARAAVAALDLRAEEFLGHKGDVFIWHEQLYHGGKPIRDLQRTRRSLVTHYWRADALELSPGWQMLSSGGRQRWLDRPHQPVPMP